jgi:hypothetical protein
METGRILFVGNSKERPVKRMSDVKTIISWLEGLTEPDWRMYHSDSEVQTIAKETLDLLKEQEAVERTYRTGINCFSIIWTCGACGSDLHPNNAKAKYCSNCGKAVKWDD